MQRVKVWAKWVGIPLGFLFLLFLLLIVYLSTRPSGIGEVTRMRADDQRTVARINVRLHPRKNATASPSADSKDLNARMSRLASAILSAGERDADLMRNAFDPLRYQPAASSRGGMQRFLLIAPNAKEPAAGRLSVGPAWLDVPKAQENVDQMVEARMSQFPPKITDWSPAGPGLNAAIDELEEALFREPFPEIVTGEFPMGLHAQTWALAPAMQWVILRAFARGDTTAAEEYLLEYTRRMSAMESAAFASKESEPSLFQTGFLLLLDSEGFLTSDTLAQMQEIAGHACLAPEEEEAAFRLLVQQRGELVKSDSRLMNPANNDIPRWVDNVVILPVWPAWRNGVDRWTAAMADRDWERGWPALRDAAITGFLMNREIPEELMGVELLRLGAPEEQTLMSRHMVTSHPNDGLDLVIFCAAAMRYKLSEGKWPRFRSDLVPAYLAETEAQPLKGERMIMESNDRPVFLTLYPTWTPPNIEDGYSMMRQRFAPNEEDLQAFRKILEGAPVSISLVGHFANEPDLGKKLLQVLGHKEDGETVQDGLPGLNKD
jgi:hypothetical protein